GGAGPRLARHPLHGSQGRCPMPGEPPAHGRAKRNHPPQRAVGLLLPPMGPAVSRNVLVPLIVACALFMENMDSTVLATSLPVIARDLSVDPIALKLALTSYLVSLAVFIPVSGWMADRFGARTIFR